MRTVVLPFYARLALLLISVVLIFIILNTAAAIFVPLVFGLLIGILLYPFNNFLERKFRFGRGLAAFTCILVFVGSTAGFFYFLVSQVVSFANDMPLLRARFQAMFRLLQHWLYVSFHINNREQSRYLSNATESVLSTAAHSVTHVVSSLTGIMFFVIFILIYTFFMLYHRKLLLRFVLHLFSIPNRERVREVIFETRSMINSYVLGLLIEMGILSVVNCVLLLALGIPYAMLLGLMAAMLNIIPYLGIYTSIVITVLVTFANTNGAMALETGAVLLVVHLVDSNILFPRIVGGRVKMNPFITILAVIVGEYLWGVPGMFLFIPITGILKIVCERVEGLEAWSILIGVDDEGRKHGAKQNKVKL